MFFNSGTIIIRTGLDLKKILVLGSEPKSLINFREKLIIKLLSKGFAVIAVANGEDRQTSKRLSMLGAKYYPIHLQRNSYNPISDILFWLRLLLMFHKEKPDILIPYTIKPIIYGCIAARIFRIDKVYPIVTGLGHVFITPKSIKSNLIRILVKRMYAVALKRVACVFFQNEDDNNFFKSSKIIGPNTKTVRLMGSGVDLDHFKKEGLPAGKIKFLMISRLLSEKGIHEYIEASRLLADFSEDANFSLLGPLDKNPTGIDEKELSSLKEKGVVNYLGSTSDVRPYLKNCTVFVLPSYREGLPRSVVEAMATGRAIITTDVPGCRDTVVDGVNGILIKPKDVNSLKKAMRWCIENADYLERMGTSSRKLAEEKFDVRDVNNLMLQAMKL